MGCCFSKKKKKKKKIKIEIVDNIGQAFYLMTRTQTVLGFGQKLKRQVNIF